MRMFKTIIVFRLIDLIKIDQGMQVDLKDYFKSLVIDFRKV